MSGLGGVTRRSEVEGGAPRRHSPEDSASRVGACVAERAGFEPATGFPEPHFQCGAIVH
jgi:hypothetical protein